MTIAFVGLDRAGKSSIKVYLESLSLNSAMNTKISNGVETYLVRNFRIDVFPGQEKLRYEETLYERLFPFVSKVVLVVDSVDRKRFPEVRKFWKFVKDMIDKYAKKEVHIVVVAHKQDLEGATTCDELKKTILDSEDIKKYRITCVETSIFDPISMSLLLRVLHGAQGVGIEDIVDVLRKESKSKIAMIFDGHLLPIAISGTKPSSEIFSRVHELVVSLEKYGYVKAFVGIFENEKVFVLSKKQNEERVIFCLVDFEENLEKITSLCDNAMRNYMSEMRKRFWKGWQ